jgi:hypothetical protein
MEKVMPENAAKRRLGLSIFFILFIYALLPAENAVGPDFLLVEPDARTAAMGNAFTGIADDSNAVLFNPAGIPSIRNSIISFTHFASFADTNYEYMSFVYPYKPWGLGGSLLFDYTMNFPEIDASGSETGQVNNYDMLATLAVGYEIVPGFSAGAAVKYFKSTLLNYTRDGFAFSLGALWKLTESPDLYIGFTIQNIGGQTAYESVTDELPANLTVGLGLKHKINDIMKITAAADIGRVIVNKYFPDIGAGAEVGFYDIVFMSAGFGLKQEGDTVSFGIGIRAMDSLRISYAFQPYENLGATHRLSLDVSL